jgi:hypothetical protein
MEVPVGRAESGDKMIFECANGTFGGIPAVYLGRG